MENLFSKEHQKHIQGSYFQKGCLECERFIGKYLISGRKFKED